MLVRLLYVAFTGRASLHQGTPHIKAFPAPSLARPLRPSLRNTDTQIPLHTLIRITPMAYGCHEERYPLPIQAVDTHRPNPKKTGKAGLASVAEDSAANEAAAEGAGAAGPGEGGVRGNVARDYFGTHTGGVAVHADSVAKALEQAKEGGDMAPSAAVTK